MTQSSLSPYLERLKALKELGLTQKSPFSPKIVFLDTLQGVAEVGDAIAQGWPVVTDYGATYGTTFPSSIRREVAAARQEVEPLAFVSLVTFREVVRSWMDLSLIHPKLINSIQQNQWDILDGVSFLRYPSNNLCVKAVGEFHVNGSGEVQTFTVDDTDPLMSYLRVNHGINYIAVRSSNITNQPEEAFARGAIHYASAIGAPILAIRSLASFNNQIEDEHLIKSNLFDQLKRKRYGSQPIIRLPSINDPPAVTLVRAGNTHPDTIRKLLKNILVDGVEFSYSPEKNTTFVRNMYSVPTKVTDPAKIRHLLLKHSDIL